MGRKSRLLRIRLRLWAPALPNLRWKSPKVSALVREYSRFAETIGGDWFESQLPPEGDAVEFGFFSG